jgi:hypothetical protein
MDDKQIETKMYKMLSYLEKKTDFVDQINEHKFVIHDVLFNNLVDTSYMEQSFHIVFSDKTACVYYTNLYSGNSADIPKWRTATWQWSDFLKLHDKLYSFTKKIVKKKLINKMVENKMKVMFS